MSNYDGADETDLNYSHDEEETVWEGRPSMKVVWVRLALVLLAILIVESVLLAVYGISSHWSRLLAYMAYALAIPLLVGKSWVNQKRESYMVTTQCIYTRVGLIKRTDDQLDLRNYLDCKRNEPSVISRLLKLGNIEVSAENDSPVLLRDIDDSELVFKLVKDTGFHARGHVVREGGLRKKPINRMLKKGGEEERSSSARR